MIRQGGFHLGSNGVGDLAPCLPETAVHFTSGTQIASILEAKVEVGYPVGQVRATPERQD